MQTIFVTGFYLALMGSPLWAIAAQPSPTAQVAPVETTAQVAPVETDVESSDYADAVITLERTACFGTCPVYQLTVYGDGRVVYEGTAFVAVIGKRTAQISPEQVQQLVTAFETANFFSLENQYVAEATDLPGAWTSISSNGQSKRVWRYGSSDRPELNNAPRSLTELENQIDQIVNSQQWVGS
ncbi:MAG: hypothetical protein KME15_06975 [Drouetiella hepatica Uher 2000/2452]|jgi:hypothetical protein|uniref:DUF6438 domain-containing protein n=1 Tax=Drouetiella hepatica Uher 2000/2452 TaxID=904376 RepID=A0A951UM87_9CYAN|nr:hypothetical protein [Drouetiella hepatica Uher 2000/2452]